MKSPFSPRFSKRTPIEVAGIGTALTAQLFFSSSATGVFTGPGVPRQGSTAWAWVPWTQDSDRLYNANNPNVFTFPGLPWNAAWDPYRNKIGPLTYVQFMMDWGRDRSPNVDNSTNADPAQGTKTPLSRLSPDCPMHNEVTAGGTFSFPPREQPMHATRRSLIAALKVVKDMNTSVSALGRDRVSIITFDGLDAYHTPKIVQSLTTNYTACMTACTTLQSVSDQGATTATEAGLQVARDHLKSVADGGQGRSYANKVIILLTDGVPNAWQSSSASVNAYVTANPSGDYYASGYVWSNAALMQTAQAKHDNVDVRPVGMGLGADYDFLDRMARVGGTDIGGQSPRGSGNPADYETKLTDVFKKIINNPGSRLVQ